MSRLGLRLRLIGTLFALSVLAAALVAVTSVALTRQAMVERATAQAVAGVRADLITAGLMVQRTSHVVEDSSGRWRVLDQLQLTRLVEELSLPDGTGVLIVQHGGPGTTTVPATTAAQIPDDLLRRVRDGLLAHIRVVQETGDPQLVVGGRVASDALELYRLVDLAPIESDLALVARRAAIAATVPVVLALLAGTIVARGVLRPVTRTRDAARRMAGGQLDVRVPVSGSDELAEMAADFNVMADALEATIAELHAVMRRQRQFVADVAHELRTPLTALTAAIDVLDEEPATVAAAPDGDDRRQATRLVIEEVRSLRVLVEDLMEISRFDAGVSLLDDHEIGLRTVVEGALRRRAFTHRVELEVGEGLRVVADPRRLDAIVGNLVGNALAHGRPPVRVVARIVDAGLWLDVVDAGPGVPPALHEEVFGRFVKADAARSRTGGSGLGLAIARENARLHGGDVTLVHSDATGSVFRWHLPASRVAAAMTADPVVAVTERIGG